MTEVPLTAPDLDQEAELLTTPAEGVPAILTTPEALHHTIAALRTGTGPIAVDAERAHGFRYSQRAYLIQLRRAGSGTHLLDPIAFGQPADLSALGDALSDAEWVIHAASQDLPCLYEVGLVPTTLFDTELAARLLNYPRVALGTMIEELLGVRLLKEHSASDWSRRPLPEEWLIYAALDVELLIELRDRLEVRLAETGKWSWAEQEFAALVASAGISPEPRRDPWRRTSGIHHIHSRRGLAYVAELWYARDAIAQRLDRAPSKILPDIAITELAATKHPDRATLRQIPAFSRRQAKRAEISWLDALGVAARLPESALPPMHIPNHGPPQSRLWPAKNPGAASRLAAVRAALLTIAERYELPVENLITPEHLRRLAWRPPTPATEDSVEQALADLGARPWQRELTVAAITPLLAASPDRTQPTS
ncbi:MAG TPA: HRDC domain-containing protein [Propionibacteriaceae bacterium]|nr:HRDC domain-containing protein [Propionibacteriaceae bacterium]